VVLGTGVLVTGLLLASGAVGAAPPVLASRVPVTLSAGSIDVGRLVYMDTVPVTTAAGTVPALQLDLDEAVFHGLGLALPCVPVEVGGLTGGSTTDGTSSASHVTVYATDVAATIGGTAVRLSSTDPAYPPPDTPGTVLVADGTLTDATMVTVLTSAPDLRVQGLTTSAAFCKPGASPALSGIPLAGVPTPAQTTTPAPGATTTPAPGSTGTTAPPPSGDGGSSAGTATPPAPASDPPTSAPGPAPEPGAGTPTDPVAPASTTEPSPAPAEPTPTP
jgi:hypothetical protein